MTGIDGSAPNLPAPSTEKNNKDTNGEKTGLDGSVPKSLESGINDNNE